MGKPIICTCKNKDTVTEKLISAFVFATWIAQFLYFLNLKFPAFSHLLCLYSLVCVRPVPRPDCWFSHEGLKNDKASRLKLFCHVQCNDFVQLLPFLANIAILYVCLSLVPLFCVKVLYVCQSQTQCYYTNDKLTK